MNIRIVVVRIIQNYVEDVSPRKTSHTYKRKLYRECRYIIKHDGITLMFNSQRRLQIVRLPSPIIRH